MISSKGVIFILSLTAASWITQVNATALNKFLGYGNTPKVSMDKHGKPHVAWLNEQGIRYLDSIPINSNGIDSNMISKIGIYASTLTLGIDTNDNAHIAFRINAGNDSKILYSNNSSNHLFKSSDTIFNKVCGDHPEMVISRANQVFIRTTHWYLDSQNISHSMDLMTNNRGGSFSIIDTFPFINPWPEESYCVNRDNKVMGVVKEGGIAGYPLIFISYYDEVFDTVHFQYDNTITTNTPPMIALDTSGNAHVFWVSVNIASHMQNILHTVRVNNQFTQPQVVYTSQNEIDLSSVFIDSHDSIHAVFFNIPTSDGGLRKTIYYTVGTSMGFLSPRDLNLLFGYDKIINGTYTMAFSKVVYDALGNIFVIYQIQRPDSDRRIYASIFSLDTILSLPVTHVMPKMPDGFHIQNTVQYSIVNSSMEFRLADNTSKSTVSIYDLQGRLINRIYLSYQSPIRHVFLRNDAYLIRINENSIFTDKIIICR